MDLVVIQRPTFGMAPALPSFVLQNGNRVAISPPHTSPSRQSVAAQVRYFQHSTHPHDMMLLSTKQVSRRIGEARLLE